MPEDECNLREVYNQFTKELGLLHAKWNSKNQIISKQLLKIYCLISSEVYPAVRAYFNN